MDCKLRQVVVLFSASTEQYWVVHPRPVTSAEWVWGGAP